VSVSLENVTANIQQVQSDIQATRVEAAEQRDKETCINNIILYKVPKNGEDRIEDRNKQDMAFCLNLFNNCMQVGIGEEDLLNVFRLGKYPTPVVSSLTGQRVSVSPRPLMVQLVSYTLKNIIMESIYRLRNSEEKFRAIVIAHDMTKLEREQCKTLVTEAKKQAALDPSGKYLYRVRGPPGEMKILKLRKR